MKFVLVIVVLGLSFSQLSYSAETDYHSVNSIISLLLSRSRTDSDADRFNRCLEFYSAQLDETQKQFENNYVACYTQAEWSTEAASNATVRERNYQYTRIGNTCQGPNSCKRVKKATDEFDCISAETNEAATGMMVISHNVTSLRIDLEKKHKMIILDRERCKTKVQNTLHENTNAILEEWALCFSGEKPLP